MDCHADVLPASYGQRAEWYMVKDPLWRAAGMTDEPGSMCDFLCIGCIEARLGRELYADDFIDCPVNDLSISDIPRYAFSYRTPRMINRLQRNSAIHNMKGERCDKRPSDSPVNT